MPAIKGVKFGTVAVLLQVIFAILFGIFADYHEEADPKTLPTGERATDLIRRYPPFQDVHVMIFIGFGFLMTFLKRYGLTAVGINFYLAALLVQWALLVRGATIGNIFSDASFVIKIDDLITADFAAATVLISFGAVLGKTSPLQLTLMGMIEVVVAQINSYICHGLLHAVDAGESMYIHAFGAYFGLAVAFVLYNKHAMGHEKAGSAYNNDIVAFIGTIFLWLYWPSFNGGGMDGDEQHRGYINTYLSLAAATIVTFGLSAFYDKHGKFSADHIQNATLAGGVAVGTAAGMPLQPWGAIVMGSVAGFISVTGFRFLSGFMAKRMRIHDTCGVHNLHGMPAILAAVAGSIVAAMSTEEKWGRSLYEIFPDMAPKENTTEFIEFHKKFPDLDPGHGWSSSKQGANQIFALLITLGIAIVSGLITGVLMKIPILSQVHDEDELFEDEVWWNVESEEPSPAKKYSAPSGSAYSPNDAEQNSKGTSQGLRL